MRLPFDKPAPHTRTRHQRHSRLSRPQIGMLAAVVLVVLAYACYTKFGNPFASAFKLQATFANANGLVAGSPVRVAGVDVGKVSGVRPLAANGTGKQGAVVTMTLDKSAQPVHSDATFYIRPRIFLEGNFFVDLHPGTATAPVVGSGHQFPVSAGTEPVQLDQVLTSLQSATRTSLQTLIQQYGIAVRTAGSSYNASIPYWTPAYEYSSEVAHDFLGTQPGDLQNLIARGATVSAAVDHDPAALQGLISNLDSTAGALSSQRANLAAAVALLPPTLRIADPTLDTVNAVLPAVDRFATAALPGVRSAGPAIDAGLPLLTQLRGLLQPSELQGFAKRLAGTTPALASLTKNSIPLLSKQVRPAASCDVNVIYPWSQLSIDDGVFNGTKGFPVRQVFQEAVDYLPGLAGESRTFDANGPYIRVLLSGGSLTYSLSPGLFGQALEPLQSVQPQLPPGGTRPPLHPGVACETQPAITQAGLQAQVGGPITQIKSNLDAPGAKLRWADAVTAAIGELQQLTGRQGKQLTLAAGLVSGLEDTLRRTLAGTPNASQVLTRTLASIGIHL